MAGIGFRLQALVQKGTYLEATSAYLSSAFISAGPWLSGVISLTVLSRATASYLPQAKHDLLFATIIWVFAASLLTAGGPQLIVTRYLADRFYLKDIGSLAPTCTGVLCLSLPLGIMTLPFILLAPFSLNYRLLVSTLFVVLTLTWIMMMFLSATHAYVRVVWIFLCSYALGLVTSIFLGYRYGLIGNLSGFTLGQALCLSLLIVSIYQEFPSEKGVSFTYLTYITRYWEVGAIGVLYTLGIWLDSMIFWLSGQAQVIGGFYRLFPPYDVARFIMALSTIPATTMFMIHLETNFYRYYRNYYLSIQRKGRLTELVEARKGMMATVRKGMVSILKVQSIVAILLCLLSDDLTRWMGLSTRWVPLLCIDILASIGYVCVFVTMLLLLYIDQRKAALFVVGVFACCNAGLTLLSLSLGTRFYGLGYLSASVIGAIVGWLIFNSRLKKLEYLTFMTQPME